MQFDAAVPYNTPPGDVRSVNTGPLTVTLYWRKQVSTLTFQISELFWCSLGHLHELSAENFAFRKNPCR
jgi:hypothetical protein